MQTFVITIHVCGCGYKTQDKSNANKHKKVDCGHEMTVSHKEIILEESIDTYFQNIEEENKTLKAELDILKNQLKTFEERGEVIKKLQKTVKKLMENAPSMDEEDDDTGSGIVYYVTDEDVPTRGKIGRSNSTDVKRQYRRYSTFAKPLVLCMYSKDIKKDENDLKTILREHGCMDESMGKETVHHNETTMRLFQEFANNR